MEIPEEDLRKDLSECDSCILYQPLDDEVSYDEVPALEDSYLRERYFLPQEISCDPVEEARTVLYLFQAKNPCVLVPGRAFDATGTRHGRGGGWFDRFLASIPEEWLRVGLVSEDAFSSERLVRTSWDEPVDRVVVVSEEWQRFYKTHARE